MQTKIQKFTVYVTEVPCGNIGLALANKEMTKIEKLLKQWRFLGATVT